MKEEYRRAFSEVYEIFRLMPNELIKKIPNKFYKMIEEERNIEYTPEIQEPLEKCKLMNETIIILGLIYRDFLCSADEKKRLQEKDAKEMQEVKKALEEELRQKYNPDDIFKNRNIQPENKIQENYEEKSIAVIQEEKWYQKIFSIIKNIFKRK